MIDDPIARDFSTVRTPVLSFLINHELFRIELAEKLGVPVAPVKKESKRGKRDNDKLQATYREHRRKKWEPIFKSLGGSGDTVQLAVAAKRKGVAINNTMYLLIKDGFVVREALSNVRRGEGGRKAQVWKWVGNVEA